jgi:CRISPR system Cascade subunit CasE
MSESNLFMVRCDLDRPRLFELARRRRVPLRDVDEGYLAHLGLRALFADQAPRPFAMRDAGRAVTVLGYTQSGSADLLRTAQALADPLDFEILRGATVTAKPMPDQWPEGHVLGFEVRVCPVIRKSGSSDKHRKGAEVDAFLSRCWEVRDGVAVDREQVYRDWLRSHLERNGAVTVREARLLRFQRDRLARSDHQPERRLVRCERPDATLAGIMEIKDGEAFRKLLARGVGRHRTFGFGMLLLRPVRNRVC